MIVFFSIFIYFLKNFIKSITFWRSAEFLWFFWIDKAAVIGTVCFLADILKATNVLQTFLQSSSLNHLKIQPKVKSHIKSLNAKAGGSEIPTSCFFCLFGDIASKYSTLCFIDQHTTNFSIKSKKNRVNLKLSTNSFEKFCSDQPNISSNYLQKYRCTGKKVIKALRKCCNEPKVIKNNLETRW